jgi:hypothetical protein
MAARFVLPSPALAFSWKRMKLGMAMAARIPMMATTIISSMSVKPPRRFLRRMLFMVGVLLVGGRLRDRSALPRDCVRTVSGPAPPYGVRRGDEATDVPSARRRSLHRQLPRRT